MVLDDEPAIGRAVQRNLTSERFKVELEYEVAPVLERLQAGHGDWDVFILDVNLRGDIDGIEVLHHLKRASARTSVVMISGNDSANTAAACLRAGAFDYLTKPIRHTELSAAVSKAASHAWAQRALQQATAESPAHGSGSALIGSSVLIQQLRNRIHQVAGITTSILIQGETGTGKELVARAIHEQSERKSHRFVPINCAALPEGLIDSTLFGHEKGAFTTALKDHPGAFVEANGGTLFLDEIGDMPLSSQVKLLRAVQEFEVRAVGASNVRRVDVRIVSATHVDLESAVKEERFRSDLLYRLDVFRLTMPSLRERIEDVPELVAHFLHKHGGSRLRRGRPQRPHEIPTVDRSTFEALMSFSWPGNVRQLENAVQSALAVCDGGTILPHHLPEWVTPRSLTASHGWRASLEEHTRRAARGTDGAHVEHGAPPAAEDDELDAADYSADVEIGRASCRERVS
jgi:DNA-binding NtrC family response regulator